MDNNLQSVIRTLLYGDIFGYALTQEELWNHLISSKKIKKKDFLTSLGNSENIYSENGFYTLHTKAVNIDNRVQRLLYSKEKIQFAYKIAKFLSGIPTVLFIGISGALAVQNATEKDDIDLFIITSEKSIWITRFSIMFVLQILGVRRKRNDKYGINKVCVNMLVSENNCSLNKDLYTAHEIVQLHPLYERNNMYREFIRRNKWIKTFLPNYLYTIKKKKVKKIRSFFIDILLKRILMLVEPIVKIIQVHYMKKNITRETITDILLAFHPFDYKNFVLKEYQKRVKRYSIPYV